MASRAERANAFLAMHRPGSPLILPNAWDAGSARVLVSLGFEAVATTSSNHTATHGRLDGSVTRDEALAHAAAIVAAVEVPVSADLEKGFADDPAAVDDTVRLAREAGLAGCSIEDFSGSPEAPIYDIGLAAERVAAAAAEAPAGEVRLVLTARAENHLHGRPDLDDTIARLVRYQEAGADCPVRARPGHGGGHPAGRRGGAAPRERPRPPRVCRRCARSATSASPASRSAASSRSMRSARWSRRRPSYEHGTYGFAQRAGAGLRAARTAFG